MIPTRAFGTIELHTEEPLLTFRSSGTTGRSARSTHFHPFPDLYRDVIDATFEAFCQVGVGTVPMLSLVPPFADLGDSSLSFMIDRVLQRFGNEESVCAIGKRGVEAAKVRSWLGSRQRCGAPALILATALSLHQALETLERLGLRFRLPPGSAIFETGGFKTREGEIDRSALLRRTLHYLDVPQTAIVREYGMTELTSHFYTRALLDGDPDVFIPPAWVRVRILDPKSLSELPPGEEGMIAILDLANVGSALHVLTEDIGVSAGDGFCLRGRAAGAELRGCSLAAEELEANGQQA